MMYGFLGKGEGGEGFDAESAVELVNSISQVASSIAEISAQKASYEQKVLEYKTALETARTQAQVDQYNQRIAYYQYVADALDEIIDAKKAINRRNNIKRVVIFGGAIAVSLWLAYSSYKK